MILRSSLCFDGFLMVFDGSRLGDQQPLRQSGRPAPCIQELGGTLPTARPRTRQTKEALTETSRPRPGLYAFLNVAWDGRRDVVGKPEAFPTTSEVIRSGGLVPRVVKGGSKSQPLLQLGSLLRLGPPRSGPARFRRQRQSPAGVWWPGSALADRWP